MLVAVGRFLHAHEAHVVRSRLEAEGIFAAVAHEHHARADWGVALAIGGVKVLVHPDDLGLVRQVFEHSQSGEFQKGLEAEFGPLDDLSCPACGSPQVVSRRALADVATSLLVLFYFWIAIPVYAARHRCEVCGTHWRGQGGS